jgi:hypothetical protein
VVITTAKFQAMIYFILQSDSESPNNGHRRRKRNSSKVRFADDMNREIHDLHQNVRDLSSDQLRLEEHLNREIDRRDR